MFVNTENNSLNILDAYNYAFAHIRSLLPKILYLAVFFYVPYFLLRYASMPFSPDLTLPPFADFPAMFADSDAFLTSLQSIEVGELTNGMAGFSIWLFFLNIFKMLITSYFGFFILYMCVKFYKGNAVVGSDFFTRDFQKKFAVALTAQFCAAVFVFLLVVCFITLLGFMSYFVFMSAKGTIHGAALDIGTALYILSFVFGLFVFVFILAMLTGGYIACLGVGVVYNDLGFFGVFGYVLKLFKSNCLKILLVSMINLILLMLLGFVFSAVFGVIKIALMFQPMPFWPLEVFADVLMLSVVNVFLGLFYIRVFLGLEQSKGILGLSR